MLLWSQFIYYTYVYPRMHLQLPPSAISINEQGALGPSESEESQALLGGTKSRSCVVPCSALPPPYTVWATDGRGRRQTPCGRRGAHAAQRRAAGRGHASAHGCARWPCAAPDGGRTWPPPGSDMPRLVLMRGGGAHADQAGVSAVNPEVVGEVFAWVCAALYLGSRMPQIYLNVRAPPPCPLPPVSTD
jgi:hypothetical protein